MDQLFSQVQTQVKPGGQRDKLIIFIHGRGKHPIKAIKKKLLLRLEQDYGAKLIMFHWPSWSGWFGFPEDKARSSVHEFTRLLRAIRRYRQQNPGVKVSLLTQSMGSIVLEEYLKHNSLKLFDTLVLSAAASQLEGHDVWLDKIEASNGKYVLFNKYDPILGKIKYRVKGKRLGKDVTSISAKSPSSYYVNFESIGIRHRYYLLDDLSDSEAGRKFFRRVLEGNEPPSDFELGKINSL